MHTYFKSWRRKAGVVTLGLACVTCCLWLRSYSTADEYCFMSEKRHHLTASMLGHIVWRSMDRLEQIPMRIGWKSTATKDAPFDAQSLPQELAEKLERFRPLHPAQWVLAYWMVAVPLTAMSSILLLWPVRRAKPPTPPSPN